MVRKMLIEGFIKPTKERIKAEKLKRRKIESGIIDECFWTVDNGSPYEDTDVLLDM